ncbi:hypothetical protein [Qipengyuania sp. ASV99]|uniref:hypothetical protein n=1 Tax=Qipengyuania sp. ASV99 TaxID=3399681 RepID=UPI003A4C5809
MILIKVVWPGMVDKAAMTHRPALVASLVFAFTALPFTAACSTAPKFQLAASAQPAPPAFVEAACGGCHAVEPPYLSPNPQAPSFESVANRPGVTKATIRAWLVDAHNYPEAMDFDLTKERVDEVAAYMITLRRADYVPKE